MIDYGRIKSSIRPEPLEITTTAVLVASDVTEYTEEIGEHVISGYEYNLKSYGKDEYLLASSQEIATLREELKVTKILLGVE